MPISNPTIIKDIGISFIEGLQAILDGKTNQSDYNDLALLVAAKANQSSLEYLTTIVNSKASQSSVDALTTIVNSKASQSSVDALTTTVSSKIDKSLTEITNYSSNDFLILEQNSNSSNKKLKISNLSISSTPEIITSTSVPGSPTQGLIWNELNATGNLVESWTRIGSLWLAAIKEISLTVTTNITSSYYFPLDSTKDIYFHSYSRFFLCTGLTTNLNGLGVDAYVYSDTSIVASPPNPLFQLNFIAQTNGQVICTTAILNKSFVGLNANSLRLTITRTGNPPSCGFGFGIRYQYIRK